MTPENAPGSLPGPTELLPGLPNAVIDLQADEGISLVDGKWRYHDAEIRPIDFVEVGSPTDPLGPGDVANRTYDVVPHAEAAGFDDSSWEVLSPPDTQRRLANGRVCFNWYRIQVTIPERVGDFDPTGSTVVFEVVIDDYAEVWVDGAMPLALGQAGGRVVGGFNVPNRVVLGTDVQAGQRFQIAVFGMNGPISASPANYIWMRTASLDFYSDERATRVETVPLGVRDRTAGTDAIVPANAHLERVAGGFEFTEGPVWTRDGALLFSSPNTNTIYRWAPVEGISVFRAKSGYSGVDIGRYAQPGSNGLTFDPQGRLTICQHGNRRVIRVEPHGNITVMADAFDGKQLNSPNDLVYRRSDGALFFTDPPFGLPGMDRDPKKELPFSGVFRVAEGQLSLLTDELRGPNGLALSPDERYLYVGNWDDQRKVVMRYDLTDPAPSAAEGEVLFDMAEAPGEESIDGLKIDREGNLYVCGPGGIWLVSPAGEHLGTLELPESPHNLAWGDDDGATLYVTALTSIYRLRLRIRGIRPE